MTTPTKTRSKGAPNAAMVAQAQPKLYHFRETPGEILRKMRVFRKLKRSLQNRRSWTFISLLILSALCIFGVLFGRSLYPKTSAYTLSLLPIAIMYAVWAYNCRSIYHYFKYSLPGITTTSVVVLFVTSIFGIPILSEVYGGIRPDPVTVAASVATLTTLVILLFAWLRVFRLKAVEPQTFELYFCCTILERLLKELPQDQKCEVLLNPFPARWSLAQRQGIGQRKAMYLDCLLRIKAPIAANRVFTLSVLHMRKSKGRNKHKGWKHKVKLKYSYGMPGVSKDELNGAVQQMRSILRSDHFETLTGDPQKLRKEKIKFETEIDTTMTTVSAEGDSVVVTQILQTITQFAIELPSTLLPHPKIVQGIIRELSVAVTK